MYPGGKAVFETLKERDAAADNKYKLDVKAWESQQKQAQTDQANMLKLLTSGEVKAKKVGRQWRVTIAALNEYLEKADN